MSRPGSASASMPVIRRASHSLDADVVPLTTSFASTGSATGRARNGSVTTMAATTQLLPYPVRLVLARTRRKPRQPRPSPRLREQGVIDGHGHRLPGGTSTGDQPAAAEAEVIGSQRAREKKECARSCGQIRDSPARVSMPHTVRLPVCPRNPQASAQNVRNDGAVKHGAKTASSADAKQVGSHPGASAELHTVGLPKHRRCSLLHRPDDQYQCCRSSHSVSRFPLGAPVSPLRLPRRRCR